MNLYLSAGCETDSCVTLEVVSVDPHSGRVECECITHSGGAVSMDGGVITLFHVAKPALHSAEGAADGSGGASSDSSGDAPHRHHHRLRTVLSDEDKELLEMFASKRLEVSASHA